MEEQIKRRVRASLAAIGLYGMMTFVTSMRRRESAIMMALGASILNDASPIAGISNTTMP